MNRKVSDKLILNLSLYLDNSLSKVEMLEIEELLKIDPEVSAIFDSLRSTRKVLRSAPRIKRRKSFTLSADHVKQVKKESGWVGGMRLVSTFAMILLLVVFTQNMLGDWSPMSSADVSDSNLMEDTADMDAMEFAVQDSGVGKIAGDTEDAADDSRGDTVSFDAEDIEIEATELVAVECNVEEKCADPITDSDSDDVIEEGESSLSPEDAVGGGAPVAEAPLETTEDIAAADETTESDSEMDSNSGDGQNSGLADEAEAEEEVIAASEDQEAEVAPKVVDDEKDSTLLIILVVIASVSSGAYLFLRKKYS